MMATRKRGQRIGWAGYADILRTLQLRPSTTAEVGALVGIEPINAQVVLRRMRHARLIHVQAWQPTPGSNARAVSVWAAGHAPDAPYPNGKPQQAKASNNISSQLIAFASIVRALEMAITVADLAKATGVNACHLYRLLRHMRRIGLARVADWGGNRGKPAAMWELGNAPCAPRPRPIPEAVTRAKYWATFSARRRMKRAIQLTAAPIARAQEVEHA